MTKAKQQEEALFEAARNLSSLPARSAFLDQACADDPELRARIEGVAEGGGGGGGFFQRCAKVPQFAF